MGTIEIKISGMACGGCANTVRQALLALKGVAEAEVSHAEGLARIAFDPESLGPEELRSAIEAAGYQVSG